MPTTTVRLCSVEGCNRKHRAKGMCQKHYQRHNYQSRDGIKGGVVNNPECHHKGCRARPEGGGRFCLRHFRTDIVEPNRKARP